MTDLWVSRDGGKSLRIGNRNGNRMEMEMEMETEIAEYSMFCVNQVTKMPFWALVHPLWGIWPSSVGESLIRYSLADMERIQKHSVLYVETWTCSEALSGHCQILQRDGMQKMVYTVCSGGERVVRCIRPWRRTTHICCFNGCRDSRSSTVELYAKNFRESRYRLSLVDRLHAPIMHMQVVGLKKAKTGRRGMADEWFLSGKCPACCFSWT
jgi:hypothetical protein